MADVAEHHTKQKGERYQREDSWVHLLVPGNAVRVYNLLKAMREDIALYVGGGLSIFRFDGL